jgi:hypothetical protein
LLLSTSVLATQLVGYVAASGGQGAH